MGKIEKTFKGEFVLDSKSFEKKLRRIKAYVYDWDGVFNNGHKTENGSSSFSEVDSMGTNLLRFSHYLATQKNPFMAIISGENNKAAAYFAEREHFYALYTTKDKKLAIQHFCMVNQLEQSEIAFVFDDVLDLGIAATCGIRILVRHEASPLTLRYALKNELVDYCTFTDGGDNAVRESAELLMCLHDQFDVALEHRIQFSKEYKKISGTKECCRNSILLRKRIIVFMILGIIPARYGSTRFPGKPLIDMLGKTMIQRVYEQASQSKYLKKLVVATDDKRIFDHVRSFDGNAIMTKPENASGTDRCYEALCLLNESFEYVINIQGDEPLIDPEQIDELAKILDGKTELATQMMKITSPEFLSDPSSVKMVVNDKMEALYFSRSPYSLFTEQAANRMAFTS
jgi:3-deoxy-D-manno-octulosonate cytidylyltransferase